MNDYGAGDPMDERIKYTHLSPKEIATKLVNKGMPHISSYAVNNLLKEQGYRKRRMRKQNTFENVEGRNEQFERIASLRNYFTTHGLPVLSIDTKKREYIGKIARPGSYYGKESIELFDHTFDHYAKSVLIPHGIYDTVENLGYLTLGTSADTSAYSCDNLSYFWQKHIKQYYPNADQLLLLCDGGGSNCCRHYSFKKDLYHVAQQLNLQILVAHYPTYCSKWNPIEHRLFCHLTRAWDGLVFENIQIVKEQAAKTSTKNGLEVKVRINHKKYPTNRKCSKLFKSNVEQFIHFDEHFPVWNYSTAN